MTREEFYREYPEFNHIGSPTAIMEQIVVDDFKSRICKNCKYGYLEEEHLVLCKANFYNAKIYDTEDILLSNALFYPDDDYGCNKFERKK